MADPEPQPMRRIAAPRLSTAVLILSLALNAFIAGGFFYSRFEAAHHPFAGPAAQGPHEPERKLEVLAKRLGIDPDTSVPFKEMRRGFRTAQGIMTAKNRPLGEAYWEELVKPQPDEKQLQSLLDQMIANRHEFQTELSGVLVRFMATLTQDQREKLLKIVEDRTNPIGAPVRNNIGN